MRKKTKFEKLALSKTGITIHLICSVIGISMFVYLLIRNIDSEDKKILILCSVVLLQFIWTLYVAVKRAFKWNSNDSNN